MKIKAFFRAERADGLDVSLYVPTRSRAPAIHFDGYFSEKNRKNGGGIAPAHFCGYSF